MKWFKHMTDASDDEFMAELEDVFGLEGYARWWKLLEIVGAQMDGSDCCSVAYPWSKWQTLLKGKRNKLETFLKHLENQTRINLKQTGNVLEIKIPKLLKIRDEYSRKSGHATDNVAQETETDRQTKEIREKTDFSTTELENRNAHAVPNDEVCQSISKFSLQDWHYRKAIEAFGFSKQRIESETREWQRKYQHSELPPDRLLSAWHGWLRKAWEYEQAMDKRTPIAPKQPLVQRKMHARVVP